MGKSIVFIHHKGGTGKTTSCLNVAGWLVKMNKKVLVVDLDPQGNATAGLGVDRKTMDGSVYDVLFAQKNMEEIILKTDSGVDLVPSSLDLLAAETLMVGQMNNMHNLKEELSRVEEHFDYILIDVPPGSSPLMISGIVASQNMIIPLDSGVFAYETMEILKTLAIGLKEEVGVHVNVMMVLLREHSASVFERPLTGGIHNLLKEFLMANGIPTVNIFRIPFSRKVYGAQMRGMPISHYAPYSDVGRAYKRIAKEVMKYENGNARHTCNP